MALIQAVKDQREDYYLVVRLHQVIIIQMMIVFSSTLTQR